MKEWRDVIMLGQVFNQVGVLLIQSIALFIKRDPCSIDDSQIISKDPQEFHKYDIIF